MTVEIHSITEATHRLVVDGKTTHRIGALTDGTFECRAFGGGRHVVGSYDLAMEWMIRHAQAAALDAAMR